MLKQHRLEQAKRHLTDYVGSTCAKNMGCFEAAQTLAGGGLGRKPEGWPYSISIYVPSTRMSEWDSVNLSCRQPDNRLV